MTPKLDRALRIHRSLEKIESGLWVRHFRGRRFAIELPWRVRYALLLARRLAVLAAACTTVGTPLRAGIPTGADRLVQRYHPLRCRDGGPVFRKRCELPTFLSLM